MLKDQNDDSSYASKVYNSLIILKNSLFGSTIAFSAISERTYCFLSCKKSLALN